MKFVRLRVRFSPEAINPVHAAICESDAVDRDVLLYENRSAPERDTLLYRVDGDPAAFEAMLEDADQVTAWELTPPDDGTFHAFVEQATPERDQAILDSLNRTGVIAVPPISFDPDRSATFTLVGTGEAIQGVLDDLPSSLDADVVRIGEYDRRQELFDPGLTDRQRQAVEAAIESGYYDTPRTGAIADVADRLQVAPSTAAEHLRKAETNVMRAVAGLGDGRDARGSPL